MCTERRAQCGEGVAQAALHVDATGRDDAIVVVVFAARLVAVVRRTAAAVGAVQALMGAAAAAAALRVLHVVALVNVHHLLQRVTR